MQSPEILENEAQRLQNLRDYSILDSLPEREYNEITKLASYICETPISMLSLIDEKRQWVKSDFGIEMEDVDRDYAVCSHVINRPLEIMIVPDLRKDIRFHDNPVLLNGSMVFYAGVPLVSPQGYALGTLCVLDHKPGNLNQLQIDTLKALANQVISLLELRKSKRLLEEAVAVVEEKNLELERFAFVVAHDIKSPLNNISGLTKHLIKRHADTLKPEVMEIVQMLDGSSEQVKRLVDGILQYSRSENYLTENKEDLDVKKFMEEIVQHFNYHQECEFTLRSSCAKITANKSALSQILINLISNSIKYNDKK
ncbi:MAG: histidine kinase, partial [Bacteroidota bacterium]|nr:histidine kinase [Bacteroidota bacterium]